RPLRAYREPRGAQRARGADLRSRAFSPHREHGLPGRPLERPQIPALRPRGASLERIRVRAYSLKQEEKTPKNGSDQPPSILRAQEPARESRASSRLARASSGPRDRRRAGVL